MSLSIAVARPLMRRQLLSVNSSRAAARRFESSTASKATDAAKGAASKASSAASEYTAKASQGLSRVASSAGPAIAGAAKGLSGALSKVGGRTGRLIAFVERQVPFAIYYSRVGLELGKLVFRGQKMSPPSISTFQTYYQSALKTLRNPSSLFQQGQKAAGQPSAAVQQVRNLSRAQLVAGGVLLAECLGFFTVGEMVGRFKLIGYHGSTGAHH